MIKHTSIVTLFLYTLSNCALPQEQIVSSSDLESAHAYDAGAEWLSHGRDYSETRFSPLKQINDSNVNELGLMWSFDTGSFRGLEATPIVADGVLYASRPWSSVFAVDARSGELLWDYDPQVDKSMGWKACCDVVNRGVAIYNGKIFASVIDGRLLAIDAKNGELLWQVQTTDTTAANTITGAPRVVDGKVIIGNGGAELGSRGFVTAYDTESGEEVWRFWVVPGNPEEGFENPDVAAAAQTWNGQWWQYGGGGNAWDAISYDPEARIVYIGTGNGSPWSHEIRSEGKGDNLFLSSIVALNVDTGRVIWHYQTTPGENWDYTATQQLILSELTINGQPRKVIMQAPKNGFFYVLDRLTGELLSAEPYTHVTWASGVDMQTGRPIETAQARYSNAISVVAPSPIGAHNWHPMSFSPETGLVYIPSQQGTSFSYAVEENFEFKPGSWNRGIAAGNMDALSQRPESEYEEGTGTNTPTTGALLAWDPITNKVRWQADMPSHSNGGVLSTAGNLVFQGQPNGHLLAYKADNGEQVWNVDLGQGILAPPITYQLDGKQYLSILVGWGGTTSLFGFNASDAYKAQGRLWTFALGGDQNIQPVIGMDKPALTSINFDSSAEVLAQGSDLYGKRCNMCHGGNVSSGGAIADLRYASEATYDIFQDIVRKGVYSSLGMPNLGEILSESEVNAIKNYVLSKRAELIE